MATRIQNPLLPQHPYAMQVSGPSACGKTVWVKDLLTHKDSPFDKIFYYYSVWQPLYEEMQAVLGDTITFIEGLPEEAPLFDTALTTCFVFDDLMEEVNKSPWASKLYTAGCHHQNLRVLGLQQRIFTNRDQRLQCHYLCVFDYVADRGAIEPLARQLCPGKVEEFRQMYRDATAPNHGWFLIDLKKDRDPRLRFRRGWRDCYIDNAEL